MFSKIAVAASVLAAASTVCAQGSAIIQNQCSGNVYLWVTSNVPGEMQTIAPGSSFTQGYLTNPDGGGISMKLSLEPDLSGPITQYEYTVAGMLWYDISNINGFPFMSSGLTLTPSESSCRTLVCPAGVEYCSAAYNTPDENEATAACDASADTTLVLCSGQQGSAPVASSSAAPAPSSTTPVASTPVASTPVVAVVETSTTPTSTTPAPAPTTTSLAPVNVYAPDIIFTTFVTEVVTVYDKRSAAPEPTGQPAKREESLHKKRAAHRHHFNRRFEDAN